MKSERGVVPVAPGRCFCRKEGVFWSFGVETPHIPLRMQQTCPLTCCCWTASCESKKEKVSVITF